MKIKTIDGEHLSYLNYSSTFDKYYLTVCTRQFYVHWSIADIVQNKILQQGFCGTIYEAQYYAHAALLSILN